MLAIFLRVEITVCSGLNTTLLNLIQKIVSCCFPYAKLTHVKVWVFFPISVICCGRLDFYTRSMCSSSATWHKSCIHRRRWAASLADTLLAHVHELTVSKAALDGASGVGSPKPPRFWPFNQLWIRVWNSRFAGSEASGLCSCFSSNSSLCKLRIRVWNSRITGSEASKVCHGLNDVSQCSRVWIRSRQGVAAHFS